MQCIISLLPFFISAVPYSLSCTLLHLYCMPPYFHIPSLISIPPSLPPLNNILSLICYLLISILPMSPFTYLVWLPTSVWPRHQHILSMVVYHVPGVVHTALLPHQQWIREGDRRKIGRIGIHVERMGRKKMTERKGARTGERGRQGRFRMCVCVRA